MTDSPRPQYGEYAPVAHQTAAYPTAVHPAEVHPPAGHFLPDTAGVLPYGTPSPEAAKPRTLGLVACIGAIVVFVLSVAASVTAGVIAGEAADPYATFEQDMAAPLSTVDVQLGSIILLQLTVGTVIGVWALVQGIFAVVLKRGRAYGVAAIAVAVCAPVVSMIVYTVTSSVIIATRM
jgi:hypothetical protein